MVVKKPTLNPRLAAATMDSTRFEMPSVRLSDAVSGTEPPKMSYEEYVNAHYGNLKNNAETQYDTAITNAETERVRAVNDARSSYDKSLATYGSNAAALGAAGLTGSGYSDYLSSKAYAQMQGDVNAAARTKQLAVDNAAVARDNANMQADAMYMDYLNQKEAEERAKAEQDAVNKTNAYTNLYSNIGSYSAADIYRLGSALGLSDQQIAGLKNARNEYAVRQIEGLHGDYSLADLNTILGKDHPRYQEYLTKLKDTSGKIDANSFIDEDGNLVDPATAQGIIQNAKGIGADTTDAEDAYKKAYTVNTTGGATFKKDSGKDNPGTDGEKIKITAGDKTYVVQYSGKEVSSNVEKVAKSSGVKDNQVFEYDGTLYIKISGDIYHIEQRSGTNKGDYSELLKLYTN